MYPYGEQKDNSRKIRKHTARDTRTNIICRDKRHAAKNPCGLDPIAEFLHLHQKLSSNRVTAVVWWLLPTVSSTEGTVYATKSGMLGMLIKTMGGTVEKWLYLVIHRTIISSQSLVGN